jgi:hypothetical protein
VSFGGLVVTTAFGSTLSATLTGVPAGATILAFTSNSGGAPTGITDGTAYTAIGTNANISAYKLLNATAGSHTIVGSWGTNNGVDLICAWYSNGDVTGTPFVGDDSFVGSGTNIVTKSLTPAADSATLIGFVYNTGGSGTYSAGTSPNAFTLRTLTGIAATTAILEDLDLGAGTGGVAQSITAGTTANTGQFIAFLALAATAAPAGTITPPVDASALTGQTPAIIRGMSIRPRVA